MNVEGANRETVEGKGTCQMNLGKCFSRGARRSVCGKYCMSMRLSEIRTKTDREAME